MDYENCTEDLNILHCKGIQIQGYRAMKMKKCASSHLSKVDREKKNHGL